ncbi:hypothetical protein LguiA_021910 [Lonicera macranthoides]
MNVKFSGVFVRLKTKAFLKVGESDKLNLHKRSGQEINRSRFIFLRSRVQVCKSDG